MGGNQITVAAEEENCRGTDVPRGIGVCISPSFVLLSLIIRTNYQIRLTIIAIIRVVVFWNNRWGINQTSGLFPLIHWSVIEVQISVMCACLPAFRALVGRYFPSLVGSARRTYASHTMEGYNRHTGGNSNINKSVSYSVNYASRSENHSAVELVDVDVKHGV